MALLVLLAGRAPDVVSADEIVESLWGGRPMADNPVYKTINKLRRALGDRPRNATYIATVTKRGYRLLIQPGPSEDEAAEPVPEPPVTVSPGHRGDASESFDRRHTALRVSAGVAIAAIVAAAVISWSTLERGDGALQFRQLVTLPGSSSAASVSRDGRMLVFVNDNRGAPELWTMDMATGTTRRWTNEPVRGRAPSWAPDGGHIAFHRDGDIWVAAIDGAPRRLIEHGSHPRWSPDGAQLMFERGAEVWLADADGLNQRRIVEITSRDMLFVPRKPVFSPDGGTIAWFETTQGPLGDIWLFQLNSGATRQLTFDGVVAGDPAFSTDGEHVVFHSSRRGSQSLWRVPTAGGKPEQLLAGTGNAAEPALVGADSVVYTSTRPRWSLMVTDPVNGTSDVLFDSRFVVLAPELSPDGTQIVFFAGDPNGNPHLFVLPLTSGAPRQLTTGRDSVNSIPKWSADGQWIYHYESGASNGWRRTNVASGETVNIVDGWTFERVHDATPHPDGNRVVFANVEGLRVLDSRLLDLTTGAELPLPARMSWFDWSRDGRLLATDFGRSSIPVGEVVVCDVESPPAAACSTIAPRGQHPVWDAEERTVYFVDPAQDRLAVYRHDLTSGQTERVTELGPVSDIGPFIDVTADGKLIWVRHDPGRSELWQLTLR